MTQLDALTTTLTTITFGDGPEPIEQRLAAVADLVAAIARDLQAADPADPDARTHHLDRLESAVSWLHDAVKWQQRQA
jgi:hypothetical protein